MLVALSLMFNWRPCGETPEVNARGPAAAEEVDACCSLVDCTGSETSAKTATTMAACATMNAPSFLFNSSLNDERVVAIIYCETTFANSGLALIVNECLR